MQIAGQKAELFACFYRGTCEDYARHLFVSECGGGGGYGKKCLARAGGSYTEYDGVFLYQVYIFLLSDGARLYWFSLGRYAYAVVAEAFELFTALDRADDIIDGLLRYFVAALVNSFEILKHAVRGSDGIGILCAYGYRISERIVCFAIRDGNSECFFYHSCIHIEVSENICRLLHCIGKKHFFVH